MDENHFFTLSQCRFGEYEVRTASVRPIDEELSYSYESEEGYLYSYSFEVVEGGVMSSMPIHDSGDLVFEVNQELTESLASAPSSCPLKDVEVEMTELAPASAVMGGLCL